MRQPTKGQAAMFIAFIILIAGFFAYVYYNKEPKQETEAITSGDLNYVKSKCSTIGDKIYDCGQCFCIDSASGKCQDTTCGVSGTGDSCANKPVVYECGVTEGCSDTDSGQDYYLRGVVAYQSLTYIDSCSGSTLTEYSCLQGVFTQELFTCPTGCENGACTQPLCGDGTCSPSENCGTCVADCGCPQNTLCQGNSCVNKPCQSITCPDQCKSVNVLQHSGFCQQSSGQCEYTDQTCPYGCLNGECKSDPGNCGNGICDSGETLANCPQDCQDVCTSEICGNGICKQACGESNSNCAADCPPIKCTNGDKRECQYSGKTGNQTCVYGEWGDCVVDDDDEEASFCSKYPAVCVGTPIIILLLGGGGLLWWLFFRRK